MNNSRRTFLRQLGIGTATLAGGSWMAPEFIAPQIFQQAVAEETKSASESILVVIQLSGGNDGLNTVIPFSHDVYRASRPQLAIPKNDVLRIDDQLGFHPALRGLADLWEQGTVSLVQGVGYPMPNRSHFESLDIWHTCQRKTATRMDGWVGRTIDQFDSKRQSVDPWALHLGPEKQPLALTSQRRRVPSIRSLDQFRLKAGSDPAALTKLVEEEPVSQDDLLSFVQTSSSAALQISERFAKLANRGKHNAIYPESTLGTKLATAAQLIRAGLETRVYYVELDGFDTHAQQPAAHAALLRELGDALAAFQKDLTEMGQAERVATLCFSEFGRRVKENASQGTDHGAAAPLFVVGRRVQGGLIGDHPRLDDLDEGDLKFHTDFRQVYSSILESWLKVPATPIVGEKFLLLPIVRPA